MDLDPSKIWIKAESYLCIGLWEVITNSNSILPQAQNHWPKQAQVVLKVGDTWKYYVVVSSWKYHAFLLYYVPIKFGIPKFPRFNILPCEYVKVLSNIKSLFHFGLSQ